MADEEGLIELFDIPQSDPGAPRPVIHANEGRVLVAYFLAEPAAADAKGSVSGLVEFARVKSHVFGSPNDETLEGHRLAKLGLQPYSFYEVKNSAWIADLCARNRVHPAHKDSAYVDLRHFIFTFHDSTLEVVANGYSSSIEASKPIDCIRQWLGVS